ncbi:uncharacterized protein LOC119069359 [Bradysia coprophila]|uniref:uncharacterized protein LOC119069359 n=1 Tax=Bradysia coprophila TaxID=38358 RepID=UPI00187D9A07|nr:uncharacterized protein LOC119069359 [Bradysia coprophila]
MENRATKKRNCKVQPPNEDCVDNTQRDANVKEKSPSTVIVQTSQENASAKVQNLEEMRNCERENINDLHHQDLSAKKRKVRDIKKNFSIDCIASSQFIDVVDLCGYLTSNIKVDGEKNNFRKRVSVKAKTTKVCVKSSVLKKKDVKYWTNKFLKAKSFELWCVSFQAENFRIN